MSRSRKQPPTRRFAPPSPQVGGIRKMRRPRPLAAAPFLIPPPYGVETSEARSFSSLPLVGSRRAKLALPHPSPLWGGWLAAGQSGGGPFSVLTTLSTTPARLSSISEFQN